MNALLPLAVLVILAAIVVAEVVISKPFKKRDHE